MVSLETDPEYVNPALAASPRRENKMFASEE